MKKIFVVFLFLFSLNTALAQTKAYDQAVQNFQKHYNAQDYEAVYQSFSESMQQLLPLPKTNQFLSAVYQHFGKLEQTSFLALSPKKVAAYKAVFEKGTMTIILAVNKAQQLTTFAIKPYQESRNPVVSELADFPQPIAKAIAKQAKAFPNHTQLAIAILNKDNTHFYGVLKEKDTLKSIVNQDSIFEIGSITKLFTATVLAQMVQKNKVALNAPINPYFSFPFHDSVTITFKELANHTSGLSRMPSNLPLINLKNPYQSYQQKELYTYVLS